MPAAFGDQRLGVVRVTHERQHAEVVGAAIGLAVQARRRGARYSPRRSFRRPRVARSAPNTRRARRAVRARKGRSRRRARAGRSVVDAWRALVSAFSTKVGCGSSASGTFELALRNQFDAGRAEQRREFAQLAGVVRRQHDALQRRTRTRQRHCLVELTSLSHPLCSSAAFCFAISASMPSLRQIEQRVHFVAREGHAFGGALNFDEAARARHHDVHIGVALRVFVVVEIEHRQAVVHADRNRRDDSR